MVNTCLYYRMQNEGPKDGFQNLSYSDGTQFSFKLDTISPKQYLPVINLTTKLKMKEIKKQLQNSGYTKVCSEFIKGGIILLLI